MGYRASDYPAQPKPDQNAQGIDYPSAVWHWLAHDAAGFFTAGLCIVTGLLAWFTYALYRTTAQLALETREASAAALRASTEATKLARDEFNATHRPEIIAHRFEVDRRQIKDGDDVLGYSICASFTLVNKGTSDAVILDVGGRIIFDELFTPGMPLPTRGIKNRTLAAGEVLRGVEISGDPDQSATADFHTGFPNPGDPRLLCIGLIVYEDAAGRRRETGFCRAFVKGDRWVRVDDSEQEYSY